MFEFFFNLFNRKQSVELPGVDYLVSQKLKVLETAKLINADIKTAIDQRSAVILQLDNEIVRLNEAQDLK